MPEDIRGNLVKIHILCTVTLNKYYKLNTKKLSQLIVPKCTNCVSRKKSGTIFQFSKIQKSKIL